MSNILTTSTCINKIPLIGLGTFRAEDKNTLITAVKHAIKVGYRHLDCGNLVFSTSFFLKKSSIIII